MNKIAAPEQFKAEGDDKDWTYGTRVETPLGCEAGARAEARPAPDQPAKDEPHKDESKDEAPPPPPKWLFLIVGLLLVALLAWGAYTHWRTAGNAADTTRQSQAMVPEVRTAAAKSETGPVSLTLPGQTDAIEAATIYARATGYIGVRKVDIGSRVKKGDLMLHITAPDQDQQLEQAVATLGQVQAAEGQAQAQVAQAQANLNLAQVTLARTNQLTDQGYATLQTRDNQTADLKSKEAALDTAKAAVKVADANTKAQQASVDRLKALSAFEDVTAPFDGIVTARNVDVGDLVSTNGASGTALFQLQRDNVIRVTVQVPQNAAIGVRDGLDAKVEVPQMPGRTFTGNVSRTSVALISSARTLDSEVDVPNPDGSLRPGLFAYITIAIPRDRPGVVIPAEALIFDAGGLQVATLDGDKVKLQKIAIYRDYGDTVELSEGLKGGEQIVLSPPALLSDGMKVKVNNDQGKKPDDQGKQGEKKPD